MVYREATGFVRYARNLTRGEGEGGGMQMGEEGCFHADTHLLSDRGDTCSTSDPDFEENDRSISESVNYEAVCKTAPALLGLLNIYILIAYP